METKQCKMISSQHLPIWLRRTFSMMNSESVLWSDLLMACFHYLVPCYVGLLPYINGQISTWKKLLKRNCNCRRRQWHPTPVLLPGKCHGWRSLVGCSPWGREESNTAKWLHFHFSLSCIGEGNGNPLQCSCLENPKDRAAWWAAASGVTESDMTEVT